MAENKLEGWYLAPAGNGWIIGKGPVGGVPLELRPVYQLAYGVVDPQKGLIAYQASQILFFSSFDSISTQGLTLKPVSELSQVDRKMLEGVIADAEQKKAQMKAEEAGLILTTQMPQKPRG